MTFDLLGMTTLALMIFAGIVLLFASAPDD